MSKRYALPALLLGLCLSGTPMLATAESNASQQPIAVYHSNADYTAVKEALSMAITNRGLKVSGTLHVQDMLDRTGADLGFAEPVYRKAESLEFCSALISHKMTQADPLNLSICPFTIALFIRADNPKQVHLSYRKPYLAGDPDGSLQQEVEAMLKGIIEEALDNIF